MKLKSKYFVFLLIICILFSISTVSANDNNMSINQNLQNDANQDINQDLQLNDANQDINQDLELNNQKDDFLKASGDKTYNDLYNDIKNCEDTFNIENDYKYSESDNHTFISINKTNLVINGNNHVIDGSNKAGGFEFLKESLNIIINDLTFINCNDYTIVNEDGGNISLNNVNFTNNHNKLGLLYSEGIISVFNGALTINNCNFDSNNNTNLIYANFADVRITNSNFSNGKGIGSPIYVNRFELFIDNCSFENFTAPYGGAINFKGNTFTIKNSKFKNLNAEITAGSIFAKYFPKTNKDGSYIPGEDMLFENCEFSNVSSTHNGGAIYLNLDSSSEGFAKTIHINNCNITDASSDFGGAIASQGEILDFSNLNIINCHAKIGGAIYSSWADLSLKDCNIINNSADKDAGAIYFDYGKLIIDNSNFTENKVNNIPSGKESIIYANDVDAEIRNSIFDNGGVAVYANFASNSKFENNTSTDLFLWNNTNYIVSVENKGIKLNLTNNTINVDKLPSKFDGRDWGWASPLKFQGDNVACWAFATAGALECALLKQTGVLYNISENNIQNLQLKYFSEGDRRNSAIGYAYSGLGHSLSWYGAITSEDDPYDERGMYSDVAETDKRIHVQDAMIIFGGRNDTRNLMKEAIMKYGAVSIQYMYAPYDYTANYTEVDLQPGHFVTLIGWDDNCPPEKVNTKMAIDETNIPPGPGAWLMKDSEDSKLGEDGYVYLSYYDLSILSKDFYPVIPQAAGVAYIFENTNDYHVNYQTDITGLAGFDENYSYYSNEFVSKYEEWIGAVGTYFNESGIDYSFDIYLNGEKVYSQNGTSEFAGFRTIVLDKYVPIKANDTFKVIFKSNALPFQAYSRQHYIANMSMISADGSNWIDYADKNRTVCLKVYTIESDKENISSRASTIIDCKNMTTTAVASADGRVGEYFVVTLKDQNGTALTNKPIKIGFNGRVYDRVTDENGSAKLQINLAYKGTYTFAIGFLGDEDYLGAFEVAKITVNLHSPKLSASNKSYKASAKTKELTATFKTSNGNPISGKKISFTVNGKTYTASTNSNGLAKVNVSLSKKGTYSFTAKYAGDETYKATSVKSKLTLK